jgi:hypothetical protein
VHDQGLPAWGGTGVSLAVCVWEATRLYGQLPWWQRKWETVQESKEPEKGAGGGCNFNVYFLPS